MHACTKVLLMMPTEIAFFYIEKELTVPIPSGFVCFIV